MIKFIISYVVKWIYDNEIHKRNNKNSIDINIFEKLLIYYPFNCMAKPVLNMHHQSASKRNKQASKKKKKKK